MECPTRNKKTSECVIVFTKIPTCTSFKMNTALSMMIHV